MKITVIILRTLMGLVFIASAIAVLGGFAKAPPDLPEKVQTFQKGMEATGYLLYLIKITELICGLLLVSGRFVPLASVIFFPITLNIFLYHIFVFPQGLPLAIFLLVVNLVLAYVHREKYRPLFQAK
ncbi:MAG: DoxX family protein [Spirochaetaceae bacterium]|nr:DoxX family protein [Spirochaetaceae bacterium]